jgi:hypothetical protein
VSTMPSLRLIWPAEDTSDAIPFPRQGLEQPRWGRLVGVDPIKMAEKALADADAGLKNLEALFKPFEFSAPTDGPRAA